jgi:hypothetical protein
VVVCGACTDASPDALSGNGSTGNGGASAGTGTSSGASGGSSTTTVGAGGGPSSTADFETRCNGAGVARCVGFDSPDDIQGEYGDVTGILPGETTPALDASVKASGASSLMFTIPSNSGSDGGGSYFANFSDDLSLQFDGGQQFYVQWRQRMSTAFVDPQYESGGGWKQAIIGTGDQPGVPYSSCTSLEVVLQHYYDHGLSIIYNSCSGSTSHGAYDGFYEPFDSYDFKIQNARPAPYCLYSQGNAEPHTYFPPSGNCVGHVADEWVTFQINIQLGTRSGDEFVDSYVRLWIAREGQTSEPVIDWGPYNLTAGDPSENQRFGKVWLLPYSTDKDSSQAHPTAYTWYDELIVSSEPIPDPL